MAAAAPRMGAGRAGFVAGSAVLHGLALAGAIWAAGRGLPAAPAEHPVALEWENAAPGAGDAVDLAAAVPAPPAPPVPSAPPLLPDALPEPPPPAATAPAPDVVPPPPAATLAFPIPPPPDPPRRAAEPALRPPPRPPAPAQPSGGAAPLTSGEAQAIGPVVAARPAAGGANRSPDYPQASRIRGEQGRVTLLVQVDPGGEVLDLSVLGSSGHPALDQSAANAVRRWRFQPATQDGRPVFSTTTVAITFRLEGDRRW